MISVIDRILKESSVPEPKEERKAYSTSPLVPPLPPSSGFTLLLPQSLSLPLDKFEGGRPARRMMIHRPRAKSGTLMVQGSITEASTGSLNEGRPSFEGDHYDHGIEIKL